MHVLAPGPEPGPASCSKFVVAPLDHALVVPIHPLLYFDPEPGPPLFACTAQDSCLRPCSYKFERVVHSPSFVVEGIIVGPAGLGPEVGAGTALAEAGQPTVHAAGVESC